MKAGDKVKIVHTEYWNLHEIGSIQIVTKYIPDVPYGVFIDGWPYSDAEVELVDESR